MTTISTDGIKLTRAKEPKPFRPYHPTDRNALIVLLALMWAGILLGFGGDIANHFASHARPYPLIVHLHAMAFVSWPVLLTVQSVLIRNGRPTLHRNLGLAGMALAAVMVVLGPTAAMAVNRMAFGTPDADAGFFIVQATDILGFAGLAGAGFLLRNQGAAHKRLILLASLYIADAGFSRLVGPLLGPHLPHNYLADLILAYGGNDLLILALGAYDLATRRQLHPAYVAGLAWIAVLQLVATAVYMSNWWQPISLKIIGH